MINLLPTLSSCLAAGACRFIKEQCELFPVTNSEGKLSGTCRIRLNNSYSAKEDSLEAKATKETNLDLF